MRKLVLSVLASLPLAALVLAAPTVSSAASMIREPTPPQYKVEIEPHLVAQVGGFGFDYGTNGFGAGIRFGIPIAGPAFVKTINDSIAISFGPDLVHYSPYRVGCQGQGCAFYYDTGDFWALYVPVTMQWNFWLSEKWSVFGEPGLAVRHSFINNACDDRFGNCRGVTHVFGAFFGGARYHFSETTALTLRVGYPTGFSVGLSFF